MKVLGFCAIHYGAELLREALISVYGVVDKFHIAYSRQPSFGFSANLTCPDTEAQIFKIASEVLGHKLIWEAHDRFGSEAEHISERYKHSADFDVIFRIDADEIYLEPKKLLEQLESKQARYYKVAGFMHFFRDWEHYYADDQHPVRLERVVAMADDTELLSGTVLHFGWAQSLKTIRYKLSTFSHSSEIRKNYMSKYLAWTPGNEDTDLHPVYPDLWGEPMVYDKLQMPDYLKDHPRFNYTAIPEQEVRQNLLWIPMDYQLHISDDGYFGDLSRALSEKYNVFLFDGDLQKAIDFKPHTILYQASMYMEHCRILKEQTGASFVMWTGDYSPFPSQSFIEFQPIVDLYLVPFSGEQRQVYRRILNKPCEFIWEPIQSWRFLPNQQLQEGKIAYAGNLYSHLPGGESRKEIYELVKANYPTQVVFYGSGFVNGVLPVRETPKLYNESYAVICENNYWDVEDYFTPRNLGAMAAGSCALMRVFPGIEKYFMDMYHCVYYRNKYELTQALDFLYRNPDVRNSIAENGFKLAWDKFSASNWASELYELIIRSGLSRL